MEEIELYAETAVIALARLLEPLEVRVEVLLRVERRPVDPRQLRVLLVATPIRAGEARQLHGLDRLRVLQVRAAAEIREVALRVEGDRSFRRVDELDLVRLVLLEEALLRLCGGDLLTPPLASLGQLAVDLLLDPRQILLADRLRKLEVVVEAVLDRRADRDLHAGVEAPHSLGEQVRGRMAQHRERVGIVLVARRQDLDRLAVIERQPEILDAPVRTYEHRLLGELRTDRARRVEPRRAVGKLEFGVVGKDDFHEDAGYGTLRELPDAKPRKGQ